MGLMNDTIAYDKWAMVFFNVTETLILNKRKKLFRFFVLQRYFETVKLPFKTGRHLTWVCEQRLSAKFIG